MSMETDELRVDIGRMKGRIDVLERSLNALAATVSMTEREKRAAEDKLKAYTLLVEKIADELGVTWTGLSISDDLFGAVLKASRAWE